MAWRESKGSTEVVGPDEEVSGFATAIASFRSIPTELACGCDCRREKHQPPENAAGMGCKPMVRRSCPVPWVCNPCQRRDSGENLAAPLFTRIRFKFNRCLR